MKVDSNLSAIAPSVFNGANYHIWNVGIEAYLEDLDLWEAVEEDYEVSTLHDHDSNKTSKG